MNVLLLNQCFYPDVMATAQQLTDLAEGLAKEGHRVTVIASDRGYDDPTRRFPRREVWNDIELFAFDRWPWARTRGGVEQ